MTAPAMPAGARLLTENLTQWRTAINSKQTGSLAIKTADTSRPNDATYTADPHLTVPLLANVNYRYTCFTPYQAGATGSLKNRFTFPAGATMTGAWFHYDPGADDWQMVADGSTPAGGNSGFTGTGSNVPLMLGGVIIMGATAGNLTLVWGQNASNATATIVRKGGWLEVVAAS